MVEGVAWKYWTPAMGASVASCALAIAAMVESEWASGFGVSFGLVGYSDESAHFTTYLSEGNPSPNSPLGLLVTATSLQICFLIFGVLLNLGAIIFLFLFLHCLRRNLSTHHSYSEPSVKKVTGGSVACCCGCGQRWSRRKSGHGFIHRFAPAAGLGAFGLYLASAISWPIMGVPAASSFLSTEPANVQIGYCYAFVILSTILSLFGSAMAFVALRLSKFRDSHSNGMHRRGLGRGLGQASLGGGGGSGFDVEAALQSLDSEEEELKVIDRKPSRNSGKISQTRKGGMEVALSSSKKRQKSRGSSIRNFFSKIAGALRPKPKGYGKVSTVEMMKTDEIQIQPHRPADLLNPFGTHTEHTVESYLTTSTSDINAIEGNGAIETAPIGIKTLIAGGGWRDTIEEEEI